MCGSASRSWPLQKETRFLLKDLVEKMTYDCNTSPGNLIQLIHIDGNICVRDIIIFHDAAQ
jgi:hypothetical protein